MTRQQPGPDSGGGTPDLTPIEVSRVPKGLWAVAARRLIAVNQPNRTKAAAQLVDTAEKHGIDLRMMWGTVDPPARLVRDVALIVPGAGATGVMFLSAPEPGISGPEPAPRAAVVRTALAECNDGRTDRIKVVQALPEPSETWAIAAYEAAGMTSVGELVYLRRRARAADATEPPPSWPGGVTVRPLAKLSTPAEIDRLSAAMEASYVDTRDCPELCGLRATADIIASHQSVGVFDPRTWWIVERDAEPLGCLLLSRSPDFGTMELVYIGLAPCLRGGGLGSMLLRFGLGQAARLAPAHDMTCAVDARNLSAVKLYERFGFEQFAARRPFVTAI